MAILAIACAGGRVDAPQHRAIAVPTHPCNRLSVIVPFEAEVGGDYVGLSHGVWSCIVRSKQLVQRDDSDEDKPATSLRVEFVPLRPSSRQHLADPGDAIDYRLRAVMGRHYRSQSLYSISSDWTLPGVASDWLCRSARATAESGLSAGDEEIVCVFFGDESHMLLHASLKHEARDALLVAMASIHQSGNAVAPSAEAQRP